MPGYLKQIGSPFVELGAIGSTNEYAKKELLKGQVKEGTAWFADLQKEGKGQRGKKWVAKRGDNISLTLLLKPTFLKASEAFILNASIALAVLDFYKSLVGEHCTIKWSNDLYWKNKKAGGILIENKIQGSLLSHSLVGIGINVNQETFPKELPNPVSLRQITNKPGDPKELAKILCTFVEKRYHRLPTTDKEEVLQEYEACLFKLHQSFQFEKDGALFEAKILGIAPSGKLLLQEKQGIGSYGFGEIRFVF